MKITKTKLEGVFVLQTKQFKDPRGWFSESYNQRTCKAVTTTSFVQDNVSFNKKKFTFRGLHFQTGPFQQSKLIRVDQGAIVDLILDLRVKSKTYLKMITVKLDDQNKKQLFIPKGLAHGFLTLKPYTKVFYKVDKFYSPKHDQGINVLDPQIKIPGFNKTKFHLSSKDKQLPFLHESH